ncbi:Lacal_2735 family protein [Polaribacter cellanae]|uniref:Lacal_2735 family protein n=1 Tax=Polaribacter cellanae TaxID=2818493 RepID=A0A975H987_9FLAO|nr:Lacal_2735 family protein [Polaribacter cellanae]QTE22575.1 Lacal_2735 family protein [Polaribacter cellanae]
MFGLFKKKSAVEKLQEKYKKLLEEGFKLQSINRSDSDQKYLEADNLLKEIEKLKANS